MDGPVGLWVGLFIFSKIPELLDTVFLVLQKKRVIFLHWFHHVTVSNTHTLCMYIYVTHTFTRICTYKCVCVNTYLQSSLCYIGFTLECQQTHMCFIYVYIQTCIQIYTYEYMCIKKICIYVHMYIYMFCIVNKHVRIT